MILTFMQSTMATASPAKPPPTIRGSNYAGLTYEQVQGFLKADGRGGEGGWIPQTEVTRLTAGQVHPLDVGCSSPHYESFTRQYVGYRICPSQPGSGVYFYIYKKH